MRRRTCRLCDDPAVELVVPLAPTVVAGKQVPRDRLQFQEPRVPLDVYQCRRCGHVQLLDVVDPEYIYADFDFRSGNNKSLVEHFDDLAERICTFSGMPRGSYVIDVGSNDGSFLRCFQRRGMKVLGVDPARGLAKEASDAGIPSIAGFLTPELAEAIRGREGPAAVVCASHMFAHVDDLGPLTRSVRTLLAPGGLFVFEVSYVLDILERMLLGTIIHEHLSYHSVTPLVPFFRRQGLELIDVHRNGVQGGSFVGVAQLAGGQRPVSSSVGEALAVEDARGLARPGALGTFASGVAELRRAVGALANEIQEQGKTMWAFGAARSGPTLVTQLGLEGVLTCVVDDGPDKQGKFTAGDHLPIVPSSAMYERKPDYVLILAWVQAQRIIEKHQAYLDQGGRFIECIPTLRVIGKRGPELLPSVGPAAPGAALGR